jgi:diguanylate cyclase (GGDEF)-like protein
MTNPPQPAPTSAHVLVVDDDVTSARHIGDLAANLGHRVSLAKNWVEALRVFAESEIDLVFMDAVMPDMDGFKLTQLIRSRYKKRYVPIVFVTGLNDSKARQLGVEAGADDFLSKPVEDLELRVRLTAMLRIRRLTAALEEKTRELEIIATEDKLTGLKNRRRFDEAFATELSRANRYQKAFSMLLFDIDHFKRINDTFGHAVGDEVLSFVGKMMRDLVRVPDMAFRYGGEEFAILTPETRAQDASVLAERLRKYFEANSHKTSAGAQTLSVGIAGVEELSPGASAEELFAAADEALYRAKSSGRNRCCIHAITGSPATQDEDPAMSTVVIPVESTNEVAKAS